MFSCVTQKLTGISAEDMAEHRFYDIEVIEFSKDVSFIILVPPRSLVCSVQPQKLQPGRLSA